MLAWPCKRQKTIDRLWFCTTKYYPPDRRCYGFSMVPGTILLLYTHIAGVNFRFESSRDYHHDHDPTPPGARRRHGGIIIIIIIMAAFCQCHGLKLKLFKFIRFCFLLRLRVKIWFSVPISVTPKMVRRERRERMACWSAVWVLTVTEALARDDMRAGTNP
jgi:hypothetical protein